MNKRLLSTLVAALSAGALGLQAQSWPTVNVSDVMNLAGPASEGNLKSPFNGDTVWLVGTVTVPPVVDIDQGDRRRLMTAGTRWVSYVVDTSAAKTTYAGINILQNITGPGDSTVTNFDYVKTGNVIKALCVINRFPDNDLAGPQAEIIQNPDIAASVLTEVSKEVPPVPVVPVSVFYDAAGQVNLIDGAKYYGMKVELRDVRVVQNNGGILLEDSEGRRIFLRDQSGYFRTPARGLNLRDFENWAVGTRLSKVSGYISSANFPNVGLQTYSIGPAYPDDVEVSAGTTPPTIAAISRDTLSPFPSSDQAVEIAIVVEEGDGAVSAVTVEFGTDGNYGQEAEATLGEDGFWRATIPAQADGSVVRYRVRATDANGNEAVSPLASSVLAYRVLNRPATIMDVREQFISTSGATQYSGFRTTVEGVMTGASDAMGANLYIQDLSAEGAAFSGLRLFVPDPAHPLRQASVGTRVRITGRVEERFSVTQMSQIDPASVAILETDVTVAPFEVNTPMFAAGKRDGDAQAEPFESVLVKFKNVRVTNIDPDNNSGAFDEIEVADQVLIPTPSMRVELGETNLSWSPRVALPDGKQAVEVGMQGELTGLMYFSFGNYKLLPRTDDDFLAPVTSVEYDRRSNGFSVEAMPNFSVGDDIAVVLSLDKPSHAVLSVVDAQGRTVRYLHAGMLPAGTMRFAVRADLASGSYRVAAQVGGSVVTAPVVIAR